MKLSKFEWGMIAGIIFGSIAIAGLLHMVVNEVREHGLKGMVDEIWCGEKGCQ